MAVDLSNLLSNKKSLNPFGAAVGTSQAPAAPFAPNAPSDVPTQYGDRLQSKIDELSSKQAPTALPTFDIPAPTAPAKIGAFAPDSVDRFTESLGKGDYSVTPAPSAPSVTDYSAPSEPSIVPTASASENAPDDLVQKFLNDDSQDYEARKTVFESLKSGDDPKGIEDYLRSKGYGESKNEEPSYFQRLDEDAKKRFDKALEVAGSDQSRFSQVLQTGGQAAGFIGDIFGEALVSAYKTAGEPGKEKAKKLLQTDAGQSALRAISKGVEKWNEFKAENPETAGDIEAVVNIASVLPAGKGAKYVGEGAVEGAGVVGKGAMKGAEAVGEAVSKAGKPVTELYDTAITGLSKAERSGMKSNPFQKEEFDLMDTAMKSEAGIDDVKNYKADRIQAVADEVESKIGELEKTHSENGAVYNSVRESGDTVPYGEILGDFEKTLEKNGLKVEEGKVVRVPGTKSGEINEADVSKIDRLYQDIVADAAKSGNDTITASQALDARHSASMLAKYDSASTSRGQYVMMQLRSDIDRAAKKNVTGLKELDAKFADKLHELQDATRDLVYKQGADKGTIRSNFNQIIATLDKPNRAKLLARLEEVVPGIGERVSAINNLPKLFKKVNEVPSKLTAVGGATVGATTLGSVIPGVGHAVGAAIGYALGNALEGAIGAARARAIKRVLKETSEAGLKRLEEIGKKVSENAEISASEKEALESLKKRIESVEPVRVPERNVIDKKTERMKEYESFLKPTETKKTSRVSIKNEVQKAKESNRPRIPKVSIKNEVSKSKVSK